MGIIRIRFAGSRLQAKRSVMYIIRSVCNLQSGNLNQKRSAIIRQRIYTRLADKLLELIHNEFVIKSLGGSGYDGDQWLPLSPVTIDMRLKRLKQINRLRRGFKLGKMRPGSLLMEQILIETGALQDSLKPMKVGGRSRPLGQIVNLRMASFEVGTTEKPWHHYQDGQRPAKLPRRAFWPNELPEQWWSALLLEFQMALVDEIRRDLHLRARRSATP